LVFILPVSWKGLFTLFLVLAGTLSTSLTVWPVLGSGVPVEISLDLLGLAGLPVLVIDRLSAYFVLVINFTSLTGLREGIPFLVV
jgi:hypothetical protein